MGAKFNICVLSSGARQGYIVKYRVIKARGLGEIHVGGGGGIPLPPPPKKKHAYYIVRCSVHLYNITYRYCIILV